MRPKTQTLAFLKQHIAEPGSVPLCGNSIGTDRRFLQEYMPELEAFFHYRNVDVSTIKELAHRWDRAVLEAMPEKAVAHTGPSTTSASRLPNSSITATTLFHPPSRVQ